MPKQRLTKRTVEASSLKERDYFLWDTDVVGFGVRVCTTGRRVYVFKYRSHEGRQRKLRLGNHGNITVDQARKLATKAALEVAAGNDPSAEKSERRTAPTVHELCERYIRDYAEGRKKPSSIRNDQSMIDQLIVPFMGQNKVRSLTRDDVTRFHNSLRHTPYRANRALALLSKMLNLAEIWGLRVDGSNPCRHVSRFKEKKRKRYLSAEELARLSKVLDSLGPGDGLRPSAVAAIRLLLLTGCRLGEILTLKWEWVDLKRGVLQLPDSKSGEKEVHLGTPAMAVLACIDREECNPYVITGRIAGQPLINLEKPWRIVRDRAKLQDVRLHDLRHTFASFGVAANLSLPIVGKMLGHTQMATTERYAHLASDPVKAATEKVSTAIDAAMKNQTSSIVQIGFK